MLRVCRHRPVPTKRSGCPPRPRRTSPMANLRNYCRPAERSMSPPKLSALFSGKAVAEKNVGILCLFWFALSPTTRRSTEKPVSIWKFGPMSDTACSHPYPDSAGTGSYFFTQAKRLPVLMFLFTWRKTAWMLHGGWTVTVALHTIRGRPHPDHNARCQPHRDA